MLEPSVFVERFPFVLQENVVTKFVNVPEAYEFTDMLKKQFNINILSPSISGFELITPGNGVLLSQGPSSVLTEALVSNMDAIYVSNAPLSGWTKQDLVNRFPSIVDFYSTTNGELVKRTPVPGPIGVNHKTLNISDLIAACER